METKPEKLYVGSIIQLYQGGKPSVVQTLLGHPGETLEQLAGRLAQGAKAYKRDYGFDNSTGYSYLCYLGEFTHELPPPPPPPPVKVNPIAAIPGALIGKKPTALPRVALKTVKAK